MRTEYTLRFDGFDRMKYLEWMSSIPYAQHHDTQFRKVLAGTGTWLLTDPVYLDWQNSPESSIFWLHGGIGTGKSCLTYVVDDHALQM